MFPEPKTYISDVPFMCDNIRPILSMVSSKEWMQDEHWITLVFK